MRGVQLEIPLASRGAEIIHLACVTGSPGGFGFVDAHPTDRVNRYFWLGVGIVLESKCFLHVTSPWTHFQRPLTGAAVFYGTLNSAEVSGSKSSRRSRSNSRTLQANGYQPDPPVATGIIRSGAVLSATNRPAKL